MAASYSIEKMRYYFAPLEGITGYCFRQAHHQYFPGLDAYFTPFVVATYTKKLKSREKRDVLPEKLESDENFDE